MGLFKMILLAIDFTKYGASPDRYFFIINPSPGGTTDEHFMPDVLAGPLTYTYVLIAQYHKDSRNHRAHCWCSGK